MSEDFKELVNQINKEYSWALESYKKSNSDYDRGIVFAYKSIRSKVESIINDEIDELVKMLEEP